MIVTDSNCSVSISGSRLYPNDAGFSLESPIRVDDTWQAETQMLPDSDGAISLARKNVTRRVSLAMSCVSPQPDSLEAALDFAESMSSATGRIDLAFPRTGRVFAGNQATVAGWKITPQSGFSQVGMEVMCGSHGPLEVLPVLSPGHIEIIDDGTVQWMEFVFALPPGWDGQADAGYIDNPAAPTMVTWIEHSIDLQTWEQGVFYDSPTAPTADAFGWTIFRARSKYILDAKTKTGDLIWKFDTNYIDGNLAVIQDGTFDGSPLALSYPYDLNSNSQRARLQSDLRAAGFSGATVALESGQVTVTIPSVTLSFGYGINSMFFTNPRPYYDLWHRIEYYSSYSAGLYSQAAAGYEFRGDTKQFARLKTSCPWT